MFEFKVTIDFSDKPEWSTTFLAEGWADAMPQAAEIVDGNTTDDVLITDVKITRMGAAFE